MTFVIELDDRPGSGRQPDAMPPDDLQGALQDGLLERAVDEKRMVFGRQRKARQGRDAEALLEEAVDGREVRYLRGDGEPDAPRRDRAVDEFADAVLVRHGHEGIAFEVLPVDRRERRERMRFREDAEEPVARDGEAVKRRTRRCEAADADVGMAIDDGGDDRLEIHVAHDDAYAAARRFDIGDDGRHHARGDRGQAGDDDPAALARRRILDVADRGVELPKQMARRRQEADAEARQLDVPRRAVKQRAADLVFELVDGLGKRRL